MVDAVNAISDSGRFLSPLQDDSENMVKSIIAIFVTKLTPLHRMLSNATIKLIDSLKLKKYRQKYGLFIVEGQKAIRTVNIAASDSFSKVIMSMALKGGEHMLSFNESVEIEYGTDVQLQKLGFFETGTEMIALCRIPEYDPKEVLALSAKIIYLDDVQDPGNVGTIIRLADWYGIDTVCRNVGSADFYNPKTVQSTKGSIASCRLITMDIASFTEANKLPIIASTLEGSTKPVSGLERFCLVIGNESQGVNPDLIAAASHNIFINGASSRHAESLNAAVSTGILLDRLSG